MTLKQLHGTVLDHPRQVIHVVRVIDKILQLPEVDNIAGKMRAHILAKSGEQNANIVIVQAMPRKRCVYSAIPMQ